MRATFVITYDNQAAAVLLLLLNYNHKFQFVRLKLQLARQNSLERKQIESEKSKDAQNTDVSKRKK